MFRSIGMLCGISAILSGQAAIPQFKPMHEFTIPGETYLTIEAAVSEIKTKFQKPQIDKYDILIIHDKDKIIVIFQNKNRPDFVYGNPGTLPEFEVLLNTSNKVIQSNFVR